MKSRRLQVKQWSRRGPTLPNITRFRFVKCDLKLFNYSSCSPLLVPHGVQGVGQWFSSLSQAFWPRTRRKENLFMAWETGSYHLSCNISWFLPHRMQLWEDLYWKKKEEQLPMLIRENTLQALSTWNFQPEGYKNQEGHASFKFLKSWTGFVFIWVLRSTNDLFIYYINSSSPKAQPKEPQANFMKNRGYFFNCRLFSQCIKFKNKCIPVTF